MIQETILNYIDHLEDPAYVASLLSESKEDGVIEALVELLNSDNHARVGSACLFIRDLVLIASKHPSTIPFRDAFFESPIISALERMLLTDNYFMRRHCIYTLGKVGSTESVPALHHAFHILQVRDPLILPKLVGEIWWLEERKSWSLVDAMMTSPHYPIRWATLETLRSWSDNGELQDIKWHCYTSLRGDDHHFIRAEAEYEYQQALFVQRLSALSKAERRKQRKALEQYRPLVSFADIDVWFSNYMHTNLLVDYSLNEIDRFISKGVVQIARDRETYQQRGLSHAD
jgi:hypothetical protein